MALCNAHQASLQFPQPWYYGIRCVNCNYPMPVVANPDGPNATIEFPHVMVDHTCDRCQHVDTYDAATARSFSTNVRH
jgi:hypothetical protein